VLSQMVSMSASVNPLLHHKVQKFTFGTGSPGWSWKKGLKTVVVVVWLCEYEVGVYSYNKIDKLH